MSRKRTFAYSLIALLALLFLLLRDSITDDSSVHPYPDALSLTAAVDFPTLSIEPSSVVVARQTTVQFRGTVNDGTPALSLEIPQLDFRRAVTSRQLTQGMSVSVIPNQLGTFPVHLVSAGRHLASTWFTVAVPVELGPRRLGTLALQTDAPRPDTQHFFVIPLHVVTQALRGERRQTLAAKVTDRDLPVTIHYDGSFELTSVVPAGRAQHAVAQLPFRPGSEYTVSATAEGYRESEPLRLSWDDYDELLTLHVEQHTTTPHAFPASAEISIYLTHRGRLFTPPQALPVLVSLGTDLVGPPSITIPESTGIGRWKGRATQPHEQTVAFVEPTTGLKTSARLTFVFPWSSLLIGMIAAILGLLAARRTLLFRQPTSALVLEVLSGVTGAVLMYLVLLQEWIPWIGAAPTLVGWPAALCIGVLGGYSGDGTFRLVLKGLKWQSQSTG